MKAMLCTAYGPPETLVLSDVPEPQAGPGQIVVAVKACGVNFPDVLIIENKYQFKPALPFAPGAEIAGVVKEVGEGVTRFKPGDKVIASIGYGGMQEEVLVDPTRCIAMPDGMAFDVASGLILTYRHLALRAERPRQAETGRESRRAGRGRRRRSGGGRTRQGDGRTVIAGASSQEKVDLAKKHGAEDGFVYPSGKLSRDQQKELSEEIKRLTGGNGADVLYDPVGGDYCRARDPGDELGRPLPGDRLCGRRHSARPA